MGLKDLCFKISYLIPRDDFAKECLEPALKEAVSYDRASGYFSSSSLLEITDGIRSLMKKNGKIRMVISPNLSEKDQKAISSGYKLRDKPEEFVDQELLDSFILPKDRLEEERYNVLSHLIAAEILDIKIAVMKDNPAIGLFHDKLGIVTDKDGYKMAFSGSMNETIAGFHANHEYLEVFTTVAGDYRRIRDKEERFLSYWDNDDPTITVLPFPESMKKKIHEYQKPEIDWSLVEKKEETEIPRFKKGIPSIPENIQLRDYQKEAIDKWEENSYRGNFQMCTGAGKSISAVGSIIRLLKKTAKPIIVLIVVPYIHLVTQWEKDLKAFNFKYIPGYADSPVKNWKMAFETEIDDLSMGISSTNYVCLITTNASFRTPKIQRILNNVNMDILLVVDEVHNFGSKELREKLDDRFKYRLGLTATMERHYDKFGTEYLENYFAPVCITYTLKQAIADSRLAPYDYYPVPVTLTDDELEKYLKLTDEIGRHIKRDKSGKPKKKGDGSFDIDTHGEILLRHRALVVAGAVNKIDKLREVLKEMPSKDHLLVYCGTANIDPETAGFFTPDKDEMKQINAVSNVLVNEFHLNSAKYTAEVPAQERKDLTRRFDWGDIEALAAIRCLDEGVDIPSIDKAIILASSTNPKEYIQRRGRVLRQYPGKAKATIIDFVTLPTDIDNPGIVSPKEAGLAKRELARVKEFADAALNYRVSASLIDKIEEKYSSYIDTEEGI